MNVEFWKVVGAGEHCWTGFSSSGFRLETLDFVFLFCILFGC